MSSRQATDQPSRSAAISSPRAEEVRRQRLVLALVFIVALGMRSAHLSGQALHNPIFHVPGMDEGKHHEWAQLIVSGEGLGPRPFFRAPLYYYLLAGLYAAVGPNVALARGMGCLLGAVTCYLIGRLGIALGGTAVGALAGLIAACYWPLIYFDAQLLSVGLEVFLDVVLLLLLLTAVRRGSLPLFLLVGLVWGLSAITRPNILAFTPGIVAWIWIGAPLAQRRLRRLPGTALALAGAALVILPVTLRNRIVGGEWVPIATNGGVNFYIGNNPQADGETAIVPGTRRDWQGGYEDTHRIAKREAGRELSEAEVSSFWFRKGLKWIASDPAAWAKLTLHKLRLFWSPIEIANNDPIWFFARMSDVSVLYRIGFPLVACLGLAGLVLLRGEWRTCLLLVLFLLIYMATVVAFFCPGRYRLPVAPVLILLTAHGLSRLPGAWRSRHFKSLAAYAGVGCLAGLFVATNPPERAAYRRDMEGMAHYNLAMHYLGQVSVEPQASDRALEHLQQAVRLRPYHAKARMQLGLCLYDRGRRPEAEAQFTQALATSPDDADLRVFYGTFLQLTGRPDEAARQFHTVIELEPDWAEPHYVLGLTLAKRDQHAEAAAALCEALRLSPGNVGIMLALADAYAETGHLDRAQAMAEQALAAARAGDQPVFVAEAESRLSEYGERQAERPDE